MIVYSFSFWASTVRVVGVLGVGGVFLRNSLVVYQATNSEAEAKRKSPTSKSTIESPAKGTRKSTNPIGNAMRNSFFFLYTTAIKQR